MTELAETMDKAVKVMAEREGKYLTFSIADTDLYRSSRDRRRGKNSSLYRSRAE